jgi:hypothetical protein
MYCHIGDHKAVWDFFVSELSQGRIPTEITAFSTNQCFNASRAVFFCGSVHPFWLKALITKVSDQSWGEYIIEAVLWDDFPMRPVNEPAQPMKLINTLTLKETFFCFGLYNKPFTIVDSDGKIRRQ